MITTEQLDRMDAEIADLTATLPRRREQYLAELEARRGTAKDATEYLALTRRLIGLRADLFHMDVGDAIQKG